MTLQTNQKAIIYASYTYVLIKIKYLLTLYNIVPNTYCNLICKLLTFISSMVPRRDQQLETTATVQEQCKSLPLSTVLVLEKLQHSYLMMTFWEVHLKRLETQCARALHLANLRKQPSRVIINTLPHTHNNITLVSHSVTRPHYWQNNTISQSIINS